MLFAAAEIDPCAIEERSFDVELARGVGLSRGVGRNVARQRPAFARRGGFVAWQAGVFRVVGAVDGSFADAATREKGKREIQKRHELDDRELDRVGRTFLCVFELEARPRRSGWGAAFGLGGVHIADGDVFVPGALRCFVGFDRRRVPRDRDVAALCRLRCGCCTSRWSLTFAATGRRRLFRGRAWCRAGCATRWLAGIWCRAFCWAWRGC